MERRRRRWVSDDTMAKKLREMSNADLLKFAFELTDVFPRSRFRKSDIRLARAEIKRRMRRYCIVGAIKRKVSRAVVYS